jgi:hypothetical protein
VAVTAGGATLSVQHRVAQLAIRAALLRDLARLWPMFDPTDFGTFERFPSLATTLIAARHRDSAGLAVAYYQAFRTIETGAIATVRVVVPDPPDEVVSRDALRATGLLGTLNARRAGQPIETARRSGWVRLAGSATSLVLRGGRDTILGAVFSDPARPRWQRVTSGRPCAFCAMLASRGAAFGSERGADFEAHDHCSCSAEPAFSGSRLPPASEAFRRQWQETTAGLSGNDALNAFRQAVEGRQASAGAGD